MREWQPSEGAAFAALQAELAQVQAERAERAALGTGQPYNRQLP